MNGMGQFLEKAEYFSSLERSDQDTARMAFYGWCQHLSVAYVHYQLYRQGFPGPEMLRSIYEWNIERIAHPIIGGEKQ